MKKLLLSMLLLTLLIPFVSFAEDEITFRGIPWYATKAEVEAILFEGGAEKAGWSSSSNDIYRLSGTNFSSVTLGSDRVDDGGYKGWYRGIDVAGYTPSETYACYYFPIENGKVVRDEENAKFYFGWYQFDKSDFANHSAIFDDLLEKLTSVYGEPSTNETKYNTQKLWQDASGNLIRLFINDDKDYVGLAEKPATR